LFDPFGSRYESVRFVLFLESFLRRAGFTQKGRTMKANVGTMDRVFRAVGATAMITCAVIAPLSLSVRVGTFGLLGAYLLFTSLVGTCFGYRLMGMSTCSVEPR
jgi:hypothetical protein